MSKKFTRSILINRYYNIKPAYIVGNILFCLVYSCLGLPRTIFLSLQKQLKLDNSWDVIAFCVWVFRFKYKFGHLKTTINPTVCCHDIATAEFIVINLSSLPITSNDKNPVLTACSLWAALSHSAELGSKVPFLKRSELRDRLKKFIITRTKEYGVIAEQVPMAILAILEERSGDDMAVITDIKASLQNIISTEIAKQQIHLKRNFNNIELTELLDLITALSTAYGNLFLCGNTLFRFITLGFLNLNDNVVELGEYCITKSSTDVKLPAQWEKDYENSNVHVSYYSHVNRMRVKLWHHQKKGRQIIRCESYFSWQYSQCNLKLISINEHELYIPSASYIEEEFGNISNIDGLFSWTNFRARNVTFQSERPYGYNFLAKQLSDAISRSDRYSTRVIIEMIHNIYNVDVRHYLPQTDLDPIPICINSKAAIPLSREEIAAGTNIINISIEHRLSNLLVKGVQQNVDDVKTALLDIKLLFDQIQTPFFLIGGTLLGAIREGGIIHSDYDVDIGIFGKDIESATLYDTINQSNVFRLKDIVEGHLVKVMHSNGIELDIFLHDYHNNKLRHRGRVHEWFNDNFNIGTVELFGVEFNIPEDSEKWLEENYGHWQTPVIFYNVSYDTPNRKFIKETADAIYHLFKQVHKSIISRDYSDYVLSLKSLKDHFGIDLADIELRNLGGKDDFPS